ncbi:MAG: hypothetical protein AB1499_08275 [Nitrospirota bacterium]
MFLKRWVNNYALVLLCIVMVISLTEKKARARSYFLIERPELGLDVSYEYEQDRRTGPDINREDTTNILSERLDIKTSGWLYHPALASYSVTLSPQWEQAFFHPDEGEERTTRSFLQGYLTEVTFLRYKPYTLRLFANKQLSTLASSFAERSKTETDTYGAALLLKYRVLPTTIDYNHEESSQEGFFTTGGESDEFRLNMKYDRHLGQTLLNASYMDSIQTTQGAPVNLETQNAVLQNFFNLTKDGDITLSSGLSYNTAQGDFTESAGYNLTEDLQWRHLENLSTNYTFRYDRNSSESFTSETKSINFNLAHLLYETLLTSINADASASSFTGGRINLYRSGVDFNYNREVPNGTLNLNMGFAYTIADQDFEPGLVQVLDEPLTLADGVIALLANGHADLDSIVVTDITGTIFYIKDIDYRVTEIDSFARISRITGGGISSGQDVLVDYRYNNNPPFDYSIFNQSYGISLNLWSVWRTYYRFNQSKQHVISGAPPERLTDDSIHAVGTSLDWKWNRTSLEYEDLQTTNIPVTRWRIEESVTLRPSDKTFFNISGNYGENKFKETGNTERFNGLRADFQLITSSWSRLRFAGSCNKISGNGKDTIDSGFHAAFEWAYRVWRGGFSYKFLNEEDRVYQQGHNNHYVLVEVKKILF